VTGSVQLPGYQVLIGNTDGEPAAERALVAQMVTRSVDAMVFAGYDSKASDVGVAVEAGIPVALMGGRKAEPGIDILSSDDLAAGEIATRYLIGRGSPRRTRHLERRTARRRRTPDHRGRRQAGVQLISVAGLGGVVSAHWLHSRQIPATVPLTEGTMQPANAC